MLQLAERERLFVQLACRERKERLRLGLTRFTDEHSRNLRGAKVMQQKRRNLLLI